MATLHTAESSLLRGRVTTRGPRNGNHRFGNSSDTNDGGIRSAGLQDHSHPRNGRGLAVDACHVRGGRRLLVYAGRVDLELADDDRQRGDVCSDDGDHRDEAIISVKMGVRELLASTE